MSAGSHICHYHPAIGRQSLAVPDLNAAAFAAELSRARTKQDVEDRARVAERDLALATSLLKTRDAELGL